MEIQDLMTSNPAACTPDTSLQEIASMMVDCDCGMIPVISEDGSNQPIGTVTDRDIVVRALAEGNNPAEMTANEVMTDNPVTIEMDASHRDAMEMMEQHQLRRLLVIDENSECCGIISQADLARTTSEEEVGEVVQHVSEPAEGGRPRK